jgi:hypothetical protein
MSKRRGVLTLAVLSVLAVSVGGLTACEKKPAPPPAKTNTPPPKPATPTPPPPAAPGDKK